MPQLGAAGPDRPRQQSLPCWSQKLQSALQKSRIDRATTRPTAPPGRAGVEHWDRWDGAVRCVSVDLRSTQCCLAVWSRWVESSTRLGGFIALKKTTEAPSTLPK